MDLQEYVLVSRLCTHYAIELSFFYSLKDNGLIMVTTIDSIDYLHQDELGLFEKIGYKIGIKTNSERYATGSK